jgi:hypothetical protein
MTAPASPPAQFKVLCCRARRSVLPAAEGPGVLICMSCDAGLNVPRSADAAEVPAGETRWPPL